jgi:hypothetical protein
MKKPQLKRAFGFLKLEREEFDGSSSLVSRDIGATNNTGS